MRDLAFRTLLCTAGAVANQYAHERRWQRSLTMLGPLQWQPFNHSEAPSLLSNVALSINTSTGTVVVVEPESLPDGRDLLGRGFRIVATVADAARSGTLSATFSDAIKEGRMRVHNIRVEHGMVKSSTPPERLKNERAATKRLDHLVEEKDDVCMLRIYGAMAYEALLGAHRILLRRFRKAPAVIFDWSEERRPDLQNLEPLHLMRTYRYRCYDIARVPPMRAGVRLELKVASHRCCEKRARPSDPCVKVPGCNALATTFVCLKRPPPDADDYRTSIATAE